MNFVLLTATGETGAGSILGMLAMYAIIFIPIIYFMIIRPQKKQQKKQDELIRSIEVGDSILTTSGFYGVVIDIPNEEIVIVEFGNNKNCRIPMKKTAIVEVEKPVSES
ncbi:MAG: preprotein translocase subunit YajC [Lachnospiraceae bacterium]